MDLIPAAAAIPAAAEEKKQDDDEDDEGGGVHGALLFASLPLDKRRSGEKVPAA
jgi:hypothetical protein